MLNDNPENPENSLQSRLDTALARIDELAKSNEALRRDQIMIMSRASAPAPVTASANAPKLSLDGLPDPIEDRKAYDQGVAARLDAYLAQRDAWTQAQSAQVASQNSRVQGVVDMFQEKYPGYDLDGAKVVAEAVIERARARGIDPQIYVYGTPEVFMEDVAKAYDTKFGKPAPKAETATVAQPAMSPEESFFRTGGIPGGREGGAAPSAGSSVATPALKSLGDILDEGQRKVGLKY